MLRACDGYFCRLAASSAAFSWARAPLSMFDIA
jgi:hypothetical protein